MARAPLICLCVCESTRGEWHKEGSSKSLMYFTHAAYPPPYLRKGQTGLSMPSHWKGMLVLTWHGGLQNVNGLNVNLWL